MKRNRLDESEEQTKLHRDNNRLAKERKRQAETEDQKNCTGKMTDF